MAFWAQGDPNPGGGWNNMMPNNVNFGPEFDEARARYQALAGEAQVYNPNAVGATYGGATVARDDLEARKFQDANIARLQSIASGGPGGTVAPAAYANLAAAARANNAYAAGRATPNSIASTARLAGNTNDAMAAGNEANIASMKAQEQLAAYNALSPALSGMRAQDFGAASAQAGLKAQASLANAGNQQAANMANQDAWNKKMAVWRASLGQQFGADRQQFDNEMAKKRMERGEDAWADDLNWKKRMREQEAQAQTWNTMSSLFGSASDQARPKNASAASDRNQKTDIRSADDQLKAMFDAAFGGE